MPWFSPYLLLTKKYGRKVAQLSITQLIWWIVVLSIAKLLLTKWATLYVMDLVKHSKLYSSTFINPKLILLMSIFQWNPDPIISITNSSCQKHLISCAFHPICIIKLHFISFWCYSMYSEIKREIDLVCFWKRSKRKWRKHICNLIISRKKTRPLGAKYKKYFTLTNQWS